MKDYEEYILRIQTRSLGGVAPKFRARVTRELFPYKQLPALKSDAGGQDEGGEDKGGVVQEIPEDGNSAHEESKWTTAEQRKLDQSLKGWARWQVSYEDRYVKSARCAGTTTNDSGICDACEDLARSDKAFKKAVYRVSRCVYETREGKDPANERGTEKEGGRVARSHAAEDPRAAREIRPIYVQKG